MKRPPYVLTPNAESDLAAIWDYIAKDDVATANRVFDELLELFLRLAEFPESGHVREDLTELPVRFLPLRVGTPRG